MSEARESLSAHERSMRALCAPRRIYVASSWRNPDQPVIVEMLRQLGHEVYDFRNPRPGDTGFAWSDIDPDWLAWRPRPFRDALDHEVAVSGFESDFDAMCWADTFVLVLPCGRSAHLEAGWAIGAGKQTALLLHEDKFEPELMYRMADLIACDFNEVADWLDGIAMEARAIALDEYGDSLPEGVTTEAFAEAELLRRASKRLLSRPHNTQATTS